MSTGNLQVQVGVQEQVFRLEVAVHKAVAVAVHERRHDLQELVAGSALRHSPVRNEKIVQLAARGVLEHQEQRTGRVDDLVELDNVRVVEGMHNAHLAHQLVQLRWPETRLVDDFDRDLWWPQMAGDERTASGT